MNIITANQAQQTAPSKISELEKNLESNGEENNANISEELENWKKIDDLLNQKGSSQKHMDGRP